MCFSAAGSFTAAGVLAGIGAASLARNEVPSLRMFAGVPTLFAVQQALEGIVWLTIDERPPGAVARVAVLGFLGFALVLWPTWVPSALRLPEADPRRRRVLAALSWIGVATSVVSVVLLARGRPSAHVAHHSVAYDFAPGGDHRSVLLLLGYLAPTVVPFFVSTLSLARVIGVVLFGALLVTIFAERQALTSVWCFFAALLSALILVVVLERSRAATSRRSDPSLP